MTCICDLQVIRLEVELKLNGLEGVAIQIVARLSSMTVGGDILVSRAVKDPVSGSGIEFEEFGAHSLKAITEEYQLFKVGEIQVLDCRRSITDLQFGSSAQTKFPDMILNAR